MTTSRFLLTLLLALNALAFAAIMGWLGSAAPGGEPERITNQLKPEQIRLVGAEPVASSVVTEPAPATEPPAAEAVTETAAQGQELPPYSPTATPVDTPPAPESGPQPAAAPATTCVAWSELAADQADQLAARLGANGIKFTRSRKETPANWWVRIPPQGGRVQAEQKVRELREQGVADTFIVQDSGPTQYAVSLGLFRTERGAQQLLAQLRAKGVRDAGLEPRMTATFRIQATMPPDRLAAVEGRHSRLGSLRTRCAP